MFLVLFISIAQTGCMTDQNYMPVQNMGFYYDTICQIIIYDIEDGGKEEAEKVIDDAFDLCAEYEDLLSRTKEGTDVYRINHAGGEFIECDERTVELIEKGIEYGELSEGSFDITIGALSDLWDFHAENPEVPDKVKIDDAVKHVGYEMIEIDGNKVRLSDEKAQIDLGGIAKGYIADALTFFLKENGVRSGVISLGGNVVCIGEKIEYGRTEAFKIGIETPYSDRSEVSETLDMREETAVTSGVYERYFEKDGEKYHHIIDPKTGYPVKTDLLSATVKAQAGSSADCDALATICVMLGYEEAKSLLEGMDGYEGIFIDENGTLP